MPDKIYRIEKHFLISGEGWKEEREDFEGSYEAAGRKASAAARELDERFGDSHFWTVDLKSVNSGDSYFQLFHGRLS